MGGFYSLIDSTFGRVGLTSPYRLVGMASLLTAYLSYSTGGKKGSITSAIGVAGGTALVGGAGLLGYALIYPWAQREMLIPLFFKKEKETASTAFYSPRSLPALAVRSTGQSYGGACLGYNSDGKLAIVTGKAIEQWSPASIDNLVRHEKIHADQGITEPFDIFYTFSPKLRAFAELEAFSVARFNRHFPEFNWEIERKLSEEELRSIYKNKVANSIYGNVAEYEDEAVEWMKGRYDGTSLPIKTLRWKIL